MISILRKQLLPVIAPPFTARIVLLPVAKLIEGVAEPLDPFALVSARVEEELKSPLQNMLAVRLTTFSQVLNVLIIVLIYCRAI